jgi:ribosomal protein S18 acetylase RimI-like enzyme
VGKKIDGDLAFAALADAGQAQGVARKSQGGAAAWLGDTGVASSGIPTPKYNTANVLDVDAFDFDATDEWFSQRLVPWGVQVRGRQRFDYGKHLFSERLMAVWPDDLRHVSEGVVPMQADSSDLVSLVRVDESAFGVSESNLISRWIEPHLSSPEIVTAKIDILGNPIATGYVVMCDGRAGRTGHVGGVAVVPAMQRRGLGALITTWLADQAFERGADFVHLFTTNPTAARVYSRLGFHDTTSVDIYVIDQRLATSD